MLIANNYITHNRLKDLPSLTEEKNNNKNIKQLLPYGWYLNKKKNPSQRLIYMENQSISAIEIETFSYGHCLG